MEIWLEICNLNVLFVVLLQKFFGFADKFLFDVWVALVDCEVLEDFQIAFSYFLACDEFPELNFIFVDDREILNFSASDDPGGQPQQPLKMQPLLFRTKKDYPFNAAPSWQEIGFVLVFLLKPLNKYFLFATLNSLNFGDHPT